LTFRLDQLNKFTYRLTGTGRTCAQWRSEVGLPALRFVLGPEVYGISTLVTLSSVDPSVLPNPAGHNHVPSASTRPSTKTPTSQRSAEQHPVTMAPDKFEHGYIDLRFTPRGSYIVQLGTSEEYRDLRNTAHPGVPGCRPALCLSLRFRHVTPWSMNRIERGPNRTSAAFSLPLLTSRWWAVNPAKTRYTPGVVFTHRMTRESTVWEGLQRCVLRVRGVSRTSSAFHEWQRGYDRSGNI
jgi:hypothetical protein